jgi:hypothetical protein
MANAGVARNFSSAAAVLALMVVAAGPYPVEDRVDDADAGEATVFVRDARKTKASSAREAGKGEARMVKVNLR